MQRTPDFFQTHALKDFSVEEAVNIVKSLVRSDLAKYVTLDLVKPIWDDPRRREYKLDSLETFFNNRATAKRDIESMEAWTGLLVGSRDVRSKKITLEQSQGSNYVLVTDTGAVRTFGGFGPKIGPAGQDVDPPYLSMITIKVKPNKKKTDQGEITFWDGKYIVNQTALSLPEIKKYLTAKAIDIDSLTEDMKYESVVIRGQIAVIQPVDNWVDGPSNPKKDAQGNIIYKVDPKDPTKLLLDPNTKQPIPEMEMVRQTDGVGQPLIQPKFDKSKKPQFVFKAVVVDKENPDSKNRVSVQFQRTKFGEHFLMLPDAEIHFRDAAEMPVGGSEDPFSTLTQMYSNKDVLVVGTVISVKGYDNSIWYGVDGVAIFEDSKIESSKPAPAVPATQVAAPVAPSQLVSAPRPPSSPTPVVQISQPSVNDLTNLKQGIAKIFAAMGENISYEMLMSLKVLIPEIFHSPVYKTMVETFMESVRLDRKTSKQSAPQPTAVIEELPTMTTEEVIAEDVPPTPVPVKSTKQQSIESAIASHPAVAPIKPSEILTKTKAPVAKTDLVQCKKCGQMLTPNEVMTHVCAV